MKSSQLFMPVQLSVEDAYWHACTGTPVEEFAVPLSVDRDAPIGNVYLIAKWNFGDDIKDWAKRCGVITNIKS